MLQCYPETKRTDQKDMHRIPQVQKQQAVEGQEASWIGTLTSYTKQHTHARMNAHTHTNRHLF